MLSAVPFRADDGTVSRDHRYITFCKDGAEVHFAIPAAVQATVAIAAAKAMMPGWKYIERDDPTYGGRDGQEAIDRWRSDFLTNLAGTHLTPATIDRLLTESP